MHHDTFAWVRLGLLIILILAFAYWGRITETDTSMDIPEHTATTPTEAAATPAPPLSKPTEETTPQTEAATNATEPPTEPKYTAEELNMLALVIYQEAGADYCSDETRLMVGTVVMNRIADPRFPDTMYEVITEKRAYGKLHWTGLVWPERASNPEEAHAVERAYTIAKRILQGERSLPEDVIFQSEYIMGEIVAYSDGMYFCR